MGKKVKGIYWARAYSDALNPLIMNVVTIIVAGIVLGLGAGEFLKLVVLTLLLAGLLPYFFLVHLVRQKRADSLDVRDKMQRMAPFLFAIAMYLLLCVILWFWSPGSGHQLLFVVICYLLTGVLAAIITRFWKISLHTMGISTAWSVMFFLVGMQDLFSAWGYALLPVALVTIALMGLSRVSLKIHTPAQVFLGFAFGILVPFIIMSMLLL